MEMLRDLKKVYDDVALAKKNRKEEIEEVYRIYSKQASGAKVEAINQDFRLFKENTLTKVYNLVEEAKKVHANRFDEYRQSKEYEKEKEYILKVMLSSASKLEYETIREVLDPTVKAADLKILRVIKDIADENKTYINSIINQVEENLSTSDYDRVKGMINTYINDDNIYNNLTLETILVNSVN